MSSPNEEEDLLWAVGTAAQQRQWLQEDRRRCRDIQQWLASERKNFEARVLAWEKEKTVEEEKMVLVKAQMTLERATWEKEKKRETKKKDSNKDDQTIQQERELWQTIWEFLLNEYQLKYQPTSAQREIARLEMPRV